MRRSQRVGTKYLPELQAQLDRNLNQMVDTLITPHPKIQEHLGHNHKIVSSYPAYVPDAQPVHARGKIVWNKAYSFQAKGPSYLEAPDHRGDS